MNLYDSASVSGQEGPPNNQKADVKNQVIFVLVSKQSKDSPFFSVVREGCEDAASRIIDDNVTCQFVGPDSPDADAQADIITSLIDQDINGVAVGVTDSEITGDAIDKLMESGVPVITFDNDAPGSSRLAYVGTNNSAFGSELGKVLNQLRPGGGTFGIISAKPGINLEFRVQGLQRRLNRTKWREVSYSPLYCEENTTIALQHVDKLGNDREVDAVVAVAGWPMFSKDPERWFNIVQKYPRLVTVVGDGVDEQIFLFNRGAVDGLVAQEPYQMGEKSINILYDFYRKTDKQRRNITDVWSSEQEKVFGTHLLELLRVPLNLPTLHVDNNFLGNLYIVGHVLFATIAACSFFFIAWTHTHRKLPVVKASQPAFLIMICAGTLVLGSSIIPFGFDDNSYTITQCSFACMSIPWLVSIGFTIAFSALFSKLWRINKLFENSRSFRRVKVKEKDVIVPFLLLLSANIIVLICWTIVDPITYVRKSHPGTDDWNRVLSTYGSCFKNKSSLPYEIALVVLNVVVLMLATFESYKARSIQTQYSESKYITIIMASMLEAFALGIPILILVSDQPKVIYFIAIFLIFIICMSILLLIFVPKVLALREWKLERKEKKTRMTVQGKVLRDGHHVTKVRSILKQHSSEPNSSAASGLIAYKSNTVEIKKKMSTNVESDLNMDNV